MCDNRSYIAKDKKHRIKRKKQKSKRKGEWMRQTARKKNMRKVKTVAWREKSKTQKSTKAEKQRKRLKKAKKEKEKGCLMWK